VVFLLHHTPPLFSIIPDGHPSPRRDKHLPFISPRSSSLNSKIYLPRALLNLVSWKRHLFLRSDGGSLLFFTLLVKVSFWQLELRTMVIFPTCSAPEVLRFCGGAELCLLLRSPLSFPLQVFLSSRKALEQYGGIRLRLKALRALEFLLSASDPCPLVTPFPFSLPLAKGLGVTFSLPARGTILFPFLCGI